LSYYLFDAKNGKRIPKKTIPKRTVTIKSATGMTVLYPVTIL